MQPRKVKFIRLHQPLDWGIAGLNGAVILDTEKQKRIAMLLEPSGVLVTAKVDKEEEVALIPLSNIKIVVLE